MNETGPPIERLTRRLAETPDDFLEDPTPAKDRTAPAVAAVVSDLLVDLGGAPLDAIDAKKLQPNAGARLLTTTMIAAWLLHDEWFRDARRFASGAKRVLFEDLSELAQAVEPKSFVTDPDRREELARVCLTRLGLRPEGESEAMARDRLTTLSTIERQRVIRESKEAQERMRRIQEEMRRKAAVEAAPAWGRE